MERNGVNLTTEKDTRFFKNNINVLKRYVLDRVGLQPFKEKEEENWRNIINWHGIKNGTGDQLQYSVLAMKCVHYKGHPH